jgi:hypothetical protein
MRVKLVAGAPAIQATVSGSHRAFIVDTSSSISLIQLGVCSSEVTPSNLSPFGVTGNELEILGVQEVEFYLNDRRFCHHFCVCSLPTHADGNVEMDFLSERNADLNMGNLELRLLKGSNFVHGPVGQRIRQPRSEAGRPAHTVFITQNSRHSREGTQK